jgi:hypothetical protein
VLNITRQEPWEIAAQLHIRLAYPLATPERRQKLINSVCADQLATLIKDEPQRKSQLLSKFAAYNPAKDRTLCKDIITNLEEAQLVGQIVLVLVKAAATGKSPILPHPLTQPSINQIKRVLWPKRSEEEESTYDERMHDVEKRKIRSRYPVAHLAAALSFLAKAMADKGEEMTFSYRDVSFLRRWVFQANEIAGYIRATPMLKNMASQLIELVWIEPEQVFAPTLQD